MPVAHKSFRSRKTTPQKVDLPFAPMGADRFQQLMSQVSTAFAQADGGEDTRHQDRERERQQERWLAQREAAIVEIIFTMRQHGVSIHDIL